jgi:hypothetical protein
LWEQGEVLLGDDTQFEIVSVDATSQPVRIKARVIR